jgi:hypothetical protein
MVSQLFKKGATDRSPESNSVQDVGGYQHNSANEIQKKKPPSNNNVNSLFEPLQRSSSPDKSIIKEDISNTRILSKNVAAKPFVPFSKTNLDFFSIPKSNSVSRGLHNHMNSEKDVNVFKIESIKVDECVSVDRPILPKVSKSISQPENSSPVSLIPKDLEFQKPDLLDVVRTTSVSLPEPNVVITSSSSISLDDNKSPLILVPESINTGTASASSVAHPASSSSMVTPSSCHLIPLPNPLPLPDTILLPNTHSNNSKIVDKDVQKGRFRFSSSIIDLPSELSLDNFPIPDAGLQSPSLPLERKEKFHSTLFPSISSTTQQQHLFPPCNATLPSTSPLSGSSLFSPQSASFSPSSDAVTISLISPLQNENSVYFASEPSHLDNLQSSMSSSPSLNSSKLKKI